MGSISSGPASVLLVDHDQFTLANVAQVMEQAGYQCHCARDPESAIRIGRSFPLDLIVCDIRLEKVDGMDLCHELRSLPNMEEVPVIYVSAVQIPDVVRRSHDAGGAYYLRKPVDPEVLLEIVGKALWLPHLVRNQLRYEPAGSPVRPSGLTKQRAGRSETKISTPWRRD